MFFAENNELKDKKYYTDYLLSKHRKLGLSRQETADELGISLSFLDKLLEKGLVYQIIEKLESQKNQE